MLSKRPPEFDGRVHDGVGRRAERRPMPKGGRHGNGAGGTGKALLAVNVALARACLPSFCQQGRSTRMLSNQVNTCVRELCAVRLVGDDSSEVLRGFLSAIAGFRVQSANRYTIGPDVQKSGSETSLSFVTAFSSRVAIAQTQTCDPTEKHPCGLAILAHHKPLPP